MTIRTTNKEQRPTSDAENAAHGSFPEEYLGYQLARASYLVTFPDLYDQFAQFGVSVATWRILSSVLDQERMISDIGELVLMKQSALSRALDRLERDKLIIRKRSASERRLVYVGLTAKGRKLAETLRTTATAHDQNIRKLFSTGDIRQLGALLNRIISTLSK